MSEITATRQIPDAVERAATACGLGRLQRVHMATRTGNLRLGGGVIAIAIGVAMGGAYALSYGSIFSWLPWWQSFIIPLIGLIWLFVGCWTLFAPFFLPRLTVYICEKGLLYVNRKIEAIPWRKIERVWKVNRRALNRAGQTLYMIRRNDGQLFEIGPHLLNSEVLGERVVQEVTRYLLPRAMAAYTRGETVLFDEIALSERGVMLREGRRKLSWSEFARLTINEKQLEWYTHGDLQPWAILPLGAVPNVEIVRRLVAYAQRVQMRETIPKIVAYRAGATVDFGVLRVNQQGISLDGNAEFIPWSEITSVGVSDNEVIVGRKDTGQWYTFPDWMIRDAAVLKDLVEYIFQKKQI
ncbi:MAG TPA: DUF6585 family protein [Ktedonobacteraceae bacterium]|jgi:hypothetical protein|nr:DUF6585 family protein [Ktedonobacteraceae bacterium]